MSNGKDSSDGGVEKDRNNFLLNLSRDELEEIDGSESLYFHADTNVLSPTSNNDEDDVDNVNNPFVEEARTPPRVQSSHSLFGEEIMQSARLSAASSGGGAGGSSIVGYLAPRMRSDDSENDDDDDNDDTMQFHKSPYVDDHEEQGEVSDLMFSPDLSSPKSEVTTPPSTAQPVSLSPPPLHYESYSQQSSPRNSSSNNNNNSRTRPPRAPNPNHARHGGGGGGSVGPPTMVPSWQQQQQQQQPAPTQNPHLPPSRHVRAWSHGDSSYLSALTDASSLGGEQHGHHQQQQQLPMNHSSSSSAPSFPAPPRHYRHHQHQRNVSWDPASNTNSSAAVVLDGMNIDISSLQQPILDDDDDMVVDDGDDFLQQPILDDDNVDLVNHHHNTEEPTMEKEVHPVIVREAIRRAEAKVSEQFNKHDDDKQLEKDKNDRHFHRKLASRICEFETEAETQILKAIEKEMALKDKDELAGLVLPDIPESEGVDELEHDEMEHESVAAAGGGGGGSDKKNNVHLRKQSELATSVIRFAALQMALSETMAMGESLDDIHDPYNEAPRNAGENLSANTARLVNIMKVKGRLSSKLAASRRASQNKTASLDDSEEGGAALDAVETGKSRFRAGLDYTRKRGIKMPGNILKDAAHRAKEMRSDWELFGEFLKPKKATLFGRMKLFLTVMIPAMIAAAALFYGSDNPPTGRKGEKEYYDPDRASASWWILFICIRHPFVLLLALATEIVVVNFLALSSTHFIRLVGPRVSLLLAAGKGWPACLFFYGIYSLILLNGKDKFGQHWLHWQDAIDLFNSTNPAGSVTSNPMYLRILGFFVLLGFLESLKRLWMGHYLGTRVLGRYQNDVKEVVRKMYLISEVAALSMDSFFSPSKHISGQAGPPEDEGSSADNTKTPERDVTGSNADKTPTIPTSSGKNLEGSQRVSKPKMMSLLAVWTEPVRREQPQSFTTKEIFDFQQVLQLIKRDYVFSLAFGIANNREACIRSSSEVFDRLVSRQVGNDNKLRFSTIGEVTGDNKLKRKELKNIFHPNREDMLSRIDFVRSTDAVYRELRTLSANIDNSATIDKAYEKILNVMFGTLFLIMAMPVIGIDPFSLLLGLSTILVSFAFMIGSASSSYFEGILLILVRRPYEIGDRIAVSNVDEETANNGSNGWIVENIDLFTTTVRFGMTREVATLCNGSLARSRIINMKRSDQAQVLITLKFGVGEPFQKIKVFRKAVEQFVKDRVQEWIEMSAFRSTRVEADLGYIEYVVVLKHRESWQQVSLVLESKAAVSSFCLELQKQLGLFYTSPPLPVNLNTDLLGTASNKAPKTTEQPVEDSSKDEEHALLLEESISKIARLFETKKTK